MTELSSQVQALRRGRLFLGIAVMTISCSQLVAAYPAVSNHHHHHGHVNKRQSYARNNQLPAPQDPYFGQASYNNYNYDFSNSPSRSRSGYNNNGYHQPNYHDYTPSQQQYYYGGRDPFQGANPIQREINVRNGQLRQKEYQQRTGQEGRDTYDPFYFYVNPVAASSGSGAAPPPPHLSQPPSSSAPVSSSSGSSGGVEPPAPTQVSTALTAQAVSVSREHQGGPPRNRRNSLPRDAYFDNEISGDKYEILTSKPNYQRLENQYPHPHPPPFASSRYSNAAGGGGAVGSSSSYRHQPQTQNPNQFLNYEQIVGAQPPRYASGSPPPPNRGQPWSIQIGTQLKVNDDGKGPNSGSRYYVRDERNTRPRQPHYHRK